MVFRYLSTTHYLILIKLSIWFSIIFFFYWIIKWRLIILLLFIDLFKLVLFRMFWSLNFWVFRCLPYWGTWEILSEHFIQSLGIHCFHSAVYTIGCNLILVNSLVNLTFFVSWTAVYINFMIWFEDWNRDPELTW